MLRATARDVPDREAVIAGELRLNYRAYEQSVAGLAELLPTVAGGPVRGRPVALLLANSAESCVVTFAVMAAGASVVPLNPLYTARELGQILQDADPALVIHDADKSEVVAQALSSRPVPCLPLSGTGRDLADWLARAVDSGEELPSPDDVAFVQYTGGTTGRPKGVVLTHRAVSTNVSQREWALPVSREGERILCVMPLFHSYALAMGLFLSAYAGGTLYVHRRYQPEEVLRALALDRITVFPGSPTIFTGLMAHPAFAATDFTSLHTCFSGSAALPRATLERWEQATGSPIYEGYGQTECGPVLTYNAIGLPRKPGSVGIPLWGTDVQVVDLDTGNRVLPPGVPGEVRARGPQLMREYLNLPEETARTLRDGWIHTGDIGEFDADGYLHIRDRKKDMVIVSGYNVYPREVEDVLLMHPEVEEAAVVGAPDGYRGERVHAFVRLCAGSRTAPEQLLAHCAAHLARYKLPAALTCMEALPKTPVNKTDKKVLRALALEAAASP